jgi:hypothetical protein
MRTGIEAMTTITYVLADLAEDGRIALAAISDDPRANDVLHALAFVRSADGRWSGSQLNNRLVGIHLSLPAEPFDAVGVAIDGGVCEISASQHQWSLVERGDEGPNTLVPLATSRRAGKIIVAGGMQRRMYAGGSSGWSRIDDGLRIPANDLSIGGILALDGSSPEHLWAAGYGGEIWLRKHAAWHRIDSPTAMKLSALRQRPDGSVVVAGANGALYAGNQSSWRYIGGLEPYAATAIENFRGETYVAVHGGALYVLQPRGVERIEACLDFPVHAMSACATSLLAVGPLGLRMLDGSGWHEVRPPVPMAAISSTSNF